MELAVPARLEIMQGSTEEMIVVWVTDDLRAKISSSGNIYYYGNPTVHPTLTSSGKLIPKGDK